jgi:hypothetical protein
VVQAAAAAATSSLDFIDVDAPVRRRVPAVTGFVSASPAHTGEEAC